MRLRKPELIPLLFTIGAVAMFSGLGIWQIERLQWKNGLIAAIDRAQHEPALVALPASPDGLDYRNVTLTGSFMTDKTMHMIGSRQFESAGFLIITPFKLSNDGRIALVNRGFSPAGKESRPEGVQTISGVIRPLRQRRMLSPDNLPDKNIWFYEDIPAMSQFTGLPLSPLMIEAVGPQARGVYPIPSDGVISLRNDHLNYVITWFSLAFIALVMFVLYYRKLNNEPTNTP